ncbi:hypothetical protein OOK41_31415 [Micromonospora sp. NBC_01655]|uniref:hypothetical protein n=1 Tax=Micromonospora sp. NBC_01655 TaxID=2975983 RepID=UPI0022565E9F|nr:hypothetical protein [Micromonospora sp. NBC_01655]MCX4474770.1 hypothetical protein [Micromonospora sp. NBC_01655]
MDQVARSPVWSGIWSSLVRSGPAGWSTGVVRDWSRSAAADLVRRVVQVRGFGLVHRAGPESVQPLLRNLVRDLVRNVGRHQDAVDHPVAGLRPGVDRPDLVHLVAPLRCRHPGADADLVHQLALGRGRLGVVAEQLGFDRQDPAQLLPSGLDRVGVGGLGELLEPAQCPRERVGLATPPPRRPACRRAASRPAASVQLHACLDQRGDSPLSEHLGQVVDRAEV